MEIVERIASFEAKTVLSRPKKSATQVGKETNQINKAEQTRNLRAPASSWKHFGPLNFVTQAV